MKLSKNKLYGFPAYLYDNFNYIYIGSGGEVDYYILHHKKYQLGGARYNSYFLEKVMKDGNFDCYMGTGMYKEYDEVAVETFNRYMLLL
jgi:hypothetical protein